MYFVLLSCLQVLLNFSCKESCIFQYFVYEVLFYIEKHLACNFFLKLIEFTDISQHNRTLTLQCYIFYQTNVFLTFKLECIYSVKLNNRVSERILLLPVEFLVH